MATKAEQREARARAVVASLTPGDMVRVCAEPMEWDGAPMRSHEADRAGATGMFERPSSVNATRCWVWFGDRSVYCDGHNLTKQEDWR